MGIALLSDSSAWAVNNPAGGMQNAHAHRREGAFDYKHIKTTEGPKSATLPNPSLEREVRGANGKFARFDGC